MSSPIEALAAVKARMEKSGVKILDPVTDEQEFEKHVECIMRNSAKKPASVRELSDDEQIKAMSDSIEKFYSISGNKRRFD